MKLFLSLVGFAAFTYVMSLIVLRSERTEPPEERPTSVPLGDPRLRGYAQNPFSLN